jgi:WD40 repeat protein
LLKIFALELSLDGRTIACGRGDGSVQQWNMDGEMIKHVWMRDRKIIESLSWSPSGSHLASGRNDGTTLIHEAESGQVAVGPIKTNQDSVMSLASADSGVLMHQMILIVRRKCCWNRTIDDSGRAQERLVMRRHVTTDVG